MAEKRKSNKLKKIEELLVDFQFLFGIQGYDRRLVLMDEDNGTDDNDDSAAEINFDEAYQFIRVKIFPCFFKESPKIQRKYILHELCHTITLPEKLLCHDLLDGKLVTKEQIRRANEKATSKIDNILDGLLQNRMKYAKTAYAKYSKVKGKVKKKVKKKK